MNRTLTLSTKGLLIAAVAALALVVAYLLGNGGASAQAQPSPATAAGDHPRTVVTTGTGRTYGVPDELSFSLSVGVVRPDLQTALADANAAMSGVLRALGKEGVRTSDIQTTGLSMNAVYDYHSYGPPTLRGYHVGQRAEVLVRDLAEGGKAVTAAVSAGGNDVRVTNIGLRIADPDNLLAKARADAVKQATAEARQYAAATGQTLGQVLSLREVHATPVVPKALEYSRSALDAAVPALPIRAGKDKLAVTVRIEWSFG